MGMYTEIYVNVDLLPDLPQDTLSVLQAMCGGEDKTPLEGKPDRWRYLFNNGSYYVPHTSCGKLALDDISGHYSLLGKGDIKNYEGEIQEFFAWIMPYVEGEKGDFIGYMRYEEIKEPTLIYLDRDNSTE